MLPPLCLGYHTRRNDELLMPMRNGAVNRVVPGTRTEHFPHGINLKTFYDHFLATMSAAERQALEAVFTWWRHAASRTASTAALHSGLQVITQQALSPTTHLTCDAWAHEEVARILELLQQTSPPLSNSLFETTFAQLCTDMASQHATREA